MSIKLFSSRGFSGTVAVLGIAIPLLTWLIDRFSKKDYEPVMYDARECVEKKPFEKAS
jgi:hypothetical protein